MTGNSERKPFRKRLKRAWKTYRWPLGFFALGAWMLIGWTASPVPDPIHVELWKPNNSTTLSVLSFKNGTPSAELPMQDFQQRTGNSVPTFVVIQNGWRDDGVTDGKGLPRVVEYTALVRWDNDLSTYISTTVPLPDYTFFTYVGKVRVDRENLTFDFYSDGTRQAWLIPAVGGILLVVSGLILLCRYLWRRPTTLTPSFPQSA